jgi:hypothetical protein
MAEQERKAVDRVVLMEFEVSTEEARKWLPDEIADPLLAQCEGNLPGQKKISTGPTMMTILVPVTKAGGGPRAVIDEVAKTRGRFRAIAKDSYDQGHEAIPPDQQKFKLKPL